MKRALFTLLFIVSIGYLFSASISTDKSIYHPNEKITVSFEGSSMAKDWIGLFDKDTTPAAYLNYDWVYTSGTRTANNTKIESGTVSFNSGLSEAGEYQVCLLANDGFTVMATAFFSIQELEKGLTANFSANAMLINEETTIRFTDLSSGNPSSRKWTFPGGNPSSSTDLNPIVSYEVAGNYDVILSVSDGNKTIETTKKEYIQVSPKSASTDVKILSFNTWHEGTSVENGTTYIRDIVKHVKPDIVCFSEVRNYSGDWTAKMVKELEEIGVSYYRAYAEGTDVSILSKFPISSHDTNYKGAISQFVVNIKGTEVLVCPAHLDYTYYATYLPRGYACGGSGKYAGWDALNPFAPVTDINEIKAQNLGSQRDEQIAAFIEGVKNESRPIILAGDFNEPSFLDWTERNAHLFDHNGVVYEWDTTLALDKAGFTDSYRQVFPDEVLNPGNTWPSTAVGSPTTSWTPLCDERDRIDYIYFKGEGLFAKDAALVGPNDYYVKGESSVQDIGEDIFIASDLPWPSDHKAIVATISIPTADKSIDPPEIVSKSTFLPNEDIKFTVKGSFKETDWLGIYPSKIEQPGGTPAATLWKYVGAMNNAEKEIVFNNGLKDEGQYTAFILANDGYTILARAALEISTSSNNTKVLEDGGLKIFPNPVKDKLSILSEMNENLKFSVYDDTGRKLLSNSLSLHPMIKEDIDMKYLNQGVYYILLESNNNNVSFKFLKN